MPAAWALANPSPQTGAHHRQFLFVSQAGLPPQAKTGLMREDGKGLRYLNFDVPNQASWQPVLFLADGKRVVMLSMEKVDATGKTFEQYYHRIPTHIWIYDLVSGALTEIAREQRLAPFYAPCVMLPGEKRLIVQVVDGDGTNQRLLTRGLNDEGADFQRWLP